MSKLEIDDENWRLKCPKGHTTIAPTNNHWWCRSCANHWNDEVDPEYDVAVDAKTGEEYTRDDVELNFETSGVYYA
jgi:hypothetical protein